MNVNDILNKAKKTYKDKSIIYGKSYKNHGKIMKGLFPQGIILETEEDFSRFGILNMIVGKLHRYCNSFQKKVDCKDSIIDSIHDLGMYSFILEELDFANIKHEAKPKLKGGTG